MKPRLSVGFQHEMSAIVESRHLVPALFPDDPSVAVMPAVLSTPWLVAFVEKTCIEALVPFLDEDEITLGGRIEMSHIAPTTLGQTISLVATCLEASGRRSRWSVIARDPFGEIGSGTHERIEVNRMRFAAGIQARIVRQ